MHPGEWVSREDINADRAPARGCPLAGGRGDLDQGRGLGREEYAFIG